MRDDRLYLIHISECIVRIERYTADGRDAFLADTKIQDAVLRNLQTLAESTQRLSDSLKKSRPQVDWRSIAAFRNVLVHDYLAVDLKQIWHIVEHDLPELKNHVGAMLKELDMRP
jgi:uncharacterized protein with HEPN domain